jgi:hypothetical protein
VGQQTVIADRHAEGGQQIHHDEDPEVDRVDGSVPQQDHGHQHADERDDDAEKVGCALGTGHGFRGSHTCPSISCVVSAPRTVKFINIA